MVRFGEWEGNKDINGTQLTLIVDIALSFVGGGLGRYIA
jgi:hypothetical protein